MRRPIIRADRRALNKRVVEALAYQVYVMELSDVLNHRLWAYRKAAWAIEDTPQNLSLIYRQLGRKSLHDIENVGSRLAEVVKNLLNQRSAKPEGRGGPGFPG